MPINFKTNTEAAVQSTFDLLEGKNTHYSWNPYSLNKTGNDSGELVGGNLSMIYSMMGSKEQLQTNGKILFLEDLDEYLYHIDRMMMCLKRAQLLSNLKGLIIGGMTDMNDNAIPFGKEVTQIITDVTKDYNYPVAFDAPVGHINDNKALISGGIYELMVGEDRVYLSSKV
jgi:muramoyltetrapeptide carboxypeptidase